MTEPEYIYHKGIGWVPTLTENIEMWAPWAGLTGDIPGDIKQLIKESVVYSETFPGLLQLISADPTNWNKGAIKEYLKGVLWCETTNCVICPANFERSYAQLVDDFLINCKLECCIISRLENLFTFWRSA